jgi:UPF0271 protein
LRIIVPVRAIDLNCDIGDSDPAIGPDTAELMSLVSSVNIACGVHAGTPLTVADAVRLAARCGVAIGAHPGLADRVGQGRHHADLSASDAHVLVRYQLGALAPLVQDAGARLRHVKVHGALYNLAARRRDLADAIVAAVRAFDPALILVGLSGSELLRAATAAGLRSAGEAFADRRYEPDGSLTPRAEIDALIDDEAEAVAQVMMLVERGEVRARSGAAVGVDAQTICLHGDGAHALGFARRLRGSLAAAGIAVKALS